MQPTAPSDGLLPIRTVEPAEHPLVFPGLIACFLLLCALFLYAHMRYPGLPAAGNEAGGWSAWSDQSKYITAARAWSHWDLAPALHWYPPGYALLAAPFLPITPHDRFLIPNLACLIVSQFACAALARRLFPENRFARLLGAAAFLIASLGTEPALKSWLIPWTTTPVAALTFVAFLAVLRLAEAPGVARALGVGAAVGIITLFRPGDILPIGIAAALTLAPVLLALPLRRAVEIVLSAAAAGGACIAIAIGLVAATSGFGPGTYYAISSKFGFEFGLLPLHWVTFVISARPDLDGVGAVRLGSGLHRGMCEVFPWIIPGIAGIAAAWFGARSKRVHVLMITWLVLYLAVMLSYRDLHILGFWQFGNYHYFKVTQPIFLLYALVLVARLADRTIRLRAAGAGLAAMILAFGWRTSLVISPMTLPPATSQGIPVPSLTSFSDAAVIPGTDSWNGFYDGGHKITIGGKVFEDPYDFRLYPRRTDFMLVPLRALPAGPGMLAISPDLHIAAGVRANAARQTISFGLPCAFDLAGAVCGKLGAPVIP